MVVLFLCLTMLIIFPLAKKDVGTNGFIPWFWYTFWFDENGAPGALTITIGAYGIMLIITWIFFLDKHVRFALRNREYWDIFDLSQTVIGFMVGIWTFLRRLGTLIVFGVLFISRLDKPLVPRG